MKHKHCLLIFLCSELINLFNQINCLHFKRDQNARRWNFCSAQLSILGLVFSITFNSINI